MVSAGEPAVVEQRFPRQRWRRFCAGQPSSPCRAQRPVVPAASPPRRCQRSSGHGPPVATPRRAWSSTARCRQRHHPSTGRRGCDRRRWSPAVVAEPGAEQGIRRTSSSAPGPPLTAEAPGLAIIPVHSAQRSPLDQQPFVTPCRGPGQADTTVPSGLRRTACQQSAAPCQCRGIRRLA